MSLESFWGFPSLGLSSMSAILPRVKVLFVCMCVGVHLVLCDWSTLTATLVLTKWHPFLSWFLLLPQGHCWEAGHRSPCSRDPSNLPLLVWEIVVQQLVVILVCQWEEVRSRSFSAMLALSHHNNSFKTIVGGFPGGAVVKNPPANAGDTGSSPGPGKSHMPQSN